jgi:hypothetical protein
LKMFYATLAFESENIGDRFSQKVRIPT